MLVHSHVNNHQYAIPSNYPETFMRFNIAGPVSSQWQYCVPSLARIDLADELMLIAPRKYLVMNTR